MSRTFLRGLALLEVLDEIGSIGISDLARRLGSDKGAVSRMVTACESDGWVVRRAGKVELGPRAALLGQSSATSRLVRHVEPIAHAVAGVTGLLVQVSSLVGAKVISIATASGEDRAMPSGLDNRLPLWAGAAGKIVAAQLDPRRLDALLPPSPYPDPQVGNLADETVGDEVFGGGTPHPRFATTLVHTRADLERQLARIRIDGGFEEHGEIHPNGACVGVIWPESALPTALVCIGTHAIIAARRELLLVTLRAAVRSGATRGDVVTATASALKSPG